MTFNVGLGTIGATGPKSLAKPSDWHSIQRVETVGGERTLRYLRPDLATSGACVSCHNRLERTPEIIARRLEDGVQPVKQWQLNQLMGAIEVQIPLEKIEMIAQSQKRSTLSLILAVIVAGFASLVCLCLSMLAVREPGNSLVTKQTMIRSPAFSIARCSSATSTSYLRLPVKSRPSTRCYSWTWTVQGSQQHLYDAWQAMNSCVNCYTSTARFSCQ